jgi:urate oxidase
MPSLASARYGKDNVRVCKVMRDAATGTHTVVELTVCCLLEGAIETSYTRADNSVVVATDSIKNTIFIKAKEFPVNPPELFAARLGAHFLDAYAHITAANVSVLVHRWTRIDVDGKPHPHSFYRDGDDKRTVEARVERAGSGSQKGGEKADDKDKSAPHSIEIKSGIKGLTVLKSTGSAFHGFVRDEFTTLAETWDRILSTDVDCAWTWKTFAGVDDVVATESKFDGAWNQARNITFKLFAEDESASVQNTMYKMCEDILAVVPETQAVTYALPNKHYFEVDLSWHKGLKNTGKDAEVYAPQGGPNGLIKCEVSRS